MAKFWCGSRPQRGGLHGKAAVLAVDTVNAYMYSRDDIRWVYVLCRRSAAQYSILSFHDSSPRLSNCLDVNHFIKEQRKILKTVRSQPWPMHRKVNAIRYALNVIRIC